MNRFFILLDGAIREIAIGGGDNEMVYVPELDQWIPWNWLYSTREALEVAA